MIKKKKNNKLMPLVVILSVLIIVIGAIVCVVLVLNNNNLQRSQENAKEEQRKQDAEQKKKDEEAASLNRRWLRDKCITDAQQAQADYMNNNPYATKHGDGWTAPQYVIDAANKMLEDAKNDCWRNYPD